MSNCDNPIQCMHRSWDQVKRKLEVSADELDAAENELRRQGWETSVVDPEEEHDPAMGPKTYMVEGTRPCCNCDEVRAHYQAIIDDLKVRLARKRAAGKVEP